MSPPNQISAWRRIFTPSSNAIEKGKLREVISLLKMKGNNDESSISSSEGDCHGSALNKGVLLRQILAQVTP
eukprot:3195861-Amphidinium_carterae.2